MRSVESSQLLSAGRLISVRLGHYFESGLALVLEEPSRMDGSWVVNVLMLVPASWNCDIEALVKFAKSKKYKLVNRRHIVLISTRCNTLLIVVKFNMLGIFTDLPG